jgi:hypothetical protein
MFVLRARMAAMVIPVAVESLVPRSDDTMT